jgi:predicted DNA-binding antitoxin AbrB/MazE fold protein
MSEPIQAIFENGIFRPLSPVDLPEHSYVTVLPSERPQEPVATGSSIEEQLAALGAQIPESEWSKLPADLTDRLDDYLYGTICLADN